MPFQSEKQRRYMHANLPRIAKRWERDYANGGIIALAQGGRIGFYKGSDRHEGTGGRTSSGMDMSGATNVGGTTGSGLGGGPHGGGEWSGPTYSPPKTKTFTGPNIHGEGIGSQTFDINKRTIALQDQYRQGASQRAHPFLSKVKSGIGNIFHGLGNKIFQGRGNYENQAAWEQARQDRINKKRINRLGKTRDYGKYANDPQGWAGSDLSGRLTGLEKDVFGKDYVDYGRNRIQARDLKALRDKQALTSQLSTPKRSLGKIVMDARRKNLDPGWSAHRNMTHANAPQSIKDFYTNSFKSRYDDQGLASLNDPWGGAKVQQVGYIPKEFKPSGQYSDSLAKGLYKKAIEEGVGATEFRNWLTKDGSMLKETHPDYANTLLKELQISDWGKIYPSENLDVKGRNTEAKQRSALNTLMGELETKKSTLKGTDKSWMLDPSANKSSAVSEFTSDYLENEDRLNDLGITSMEEYEDFINKAMRLEGYI